MWRPSQPVSRGILSRDLSAHGNDNISRAGDHVTRRRKNRAHGKTGLSVFHECAETRAETLTMMGLLEIDFCSRKRVHGNDPHHLFRLGIFSWLKCARFCLHGKRP